MTDELNDNLQNLPVEALEAKIHAANEPTPEPPKDEGQEVEVQAEAPEVEEETGSETATEQPEEEAEEVEQPLILGKFKSQDDLLRSYQELEKRSTKAEQMRSRYEGIASQFADFDDNGNVVNLRFPQQQTQQAPPQPQQFMGNKPTIVQQLENKYNMLAQQVGPVQAGIIINAEIAQHATAANKREILEFKAEKNVERQKSDLRRDPDFADYEDEVNSYLDKMDSTSKLNPDSVKAIYWMVRGKRAKELRAASEEEAQLKTQAIEKQKKRAKVTHQTKTPKEPEPNIESLSSDELASRFGLDEVTRW